MQRTYVGSVRGPENLAAARGAASKFSEDSGAGGLMCIGQLGQRVGGVVERCEASQVFQLFAMGRCGHDAELRAAGLESMRGFRDRGGVPGLDCGTNLLHQYARVVQVGAENFSKNIGAPRALK